MSAKTKKYEEIFALTAYCVSSLTITLLNKAVLSASSIGRFGMNFFLLAVQAVASVALLALFKGVGAVDFKPIKKSEAFKCKR